MKALTLEQQMTIQGYTDLREIDGRLCGLMRMVVTHALVVGLHEMHYEYRYCYENESDARAALAVWDGTEHPSGPWIKLKGSRSGDILNPALGIKF